MWKIGNTEITPEMANEVHRRANEEQSVQSLGAMLMCDFGIGEQDAEKIVRAVLDMNG